MKLRKNERKILEFLVRKNVFLTAYEISENLKISVSTVYRTVKSLNAAFSSERLIFSEKGKGFKLNYEFYLTIKDYKKNKTDVQVILALLTDSPVTGVLLFILKKEVTEEQKIQTEEFAEEETDLSGIVINQ